MTQFVYTKVEGVWNDLNELRPVLDDREWTQLVLLAVANPDYPKVWRQKLRGLYRTATGQSLPT